MDFTNELCRRTENCMSLFKEVLSRQRLANNDWLEDRAADFAWWSNGLNAQKTSHSSLDYRLRNRPDIQKVISGLLDSLASTLEAFLQSDQDQNLTLGGEIESDEFDQSSDCSSWSEFSDEDHQSKEKGTSTETPADTIFSRDSARRFYIETNLKLLAKISTAIRRSGAKLRYGNADADLKDHLEDDEYVQFRKHSLFLILVGTYEQQLFGELRRRVIRQQMPKAVEIVICCWIIDPARATKKQQRLIEANITRRHRIAYARRLIDNKPLPNQSIQAATPAIIPPHVPEAALAPVEKSSSFQVDAKKPLEMASPSHVTTLTATALGSHFALPSMALDTAKTSAMSIATKMTETGIHQDYPVCPVKEGNFQCPYCTRDLSKKYTVISTWRGHVAQDLNPYSCIHDDCTENIDLYATKDEWIEHVQSQHSHERWVCDECIFETDQSDDFIFGNQQLWEDHMKSCHSITGGRLTFLSNISKRRLIDSVECPLCKRPCGYSTPDQDDHIAEHLHSWALRALPWDLNPDDEAPSNRPELGSEGDHTNISDMSDPNQVLLENRLLLLQAVQRFMETTSVDDINQAIRLQEAISSQKSKEHLSSLIALGNWHGSRYERTHSLLDLEQAIRITREAIDQAADESTDDLFTLASAFGFLRGWLSKRYEQTGDESDLEEAIGMAEMSLCLTREDEPDWPGMILDLGRLLHHRSTLRGSSEDLNAAIRCFKEGLDSPLLESDTFRAIGFAGLGKALYTRFAQSGATDDLENSIMALKTLTNISFSDRPEIEAMYLSDLGVSLAERSIRYGQEDDLNAAIQLAENALYLTSEDDHQLVDRLSNFGLWLERRSRVTGSFEDLNDSIKAMKKAIGAIANDHPSRSRLLISLANSLNTLFDRTGNVTDLEDAIEISRNALRSTFPDNSIRPLILNNLGTLLLVHARHSQGAAAMQTLNEAIKFIRESVETTPVGHTDRARRFHNLGNALGWKFRQGGSTVMRDIDEAIHVTREAIGLLQKGLSRRGDILFNLGTWLIERHKITKTGKDLSEAIEHFQEVCEDENSSPSVRIISAQELSGHLAAQSRWSDANHVLGGAVKLMASLGSQSVRHTDKQDLLAKFNELISQAAAVALNAAERPYDALKLIELGRSMTASLLLDLHGDISELAVKHPPLADEFTKLRNALDATWGEKADMLGNTGVFEVSSWEAQTRQQRESEKRLDELIHHIRSQAGFSTFLLPLPEHSLTAAANEGAIVVVNISPYRCDAFLVQSTGIDVVNLPDLRLQEVYHYAKILRQSFVPSEFDMIPVLEWLWRTIARPCLDALDLKYAITDENWPHIWWIPTGLLAKFPLHAAGLYRPRSEDTVLNRTMSSYALSIRTLIQTRRHRMRELDDFATDDALLIAMHATPGLSVLNFAQKEVDMLSSMCSSLNLKTIQPDPQKAEVLKSIKSCRVFHFAGHGHSNPRNPLRSALLLNDWESDPLSVEDFRESRMQEKQPFLAYLSACSTGTNEVIDLADAGIHLISSLQLAGFRHVIGTLWEISDEQCVVVAKVFYETLCREGMTDKAICRGLHKALLALRDGNDEEEPFTSGYSIDPDYSRTPPSGLMDWHWIPYVHFGV